MRGYVHAGSTCNAFPWGIGIAGNFGSICAYGYGRPRGYGHHYSRVSCRWWLAAVLYRLLRWFTHGVKSGKPRHQKLRWKIRWPIWLYSPWLFHSSPDHGQFQQTILLSSQLSDQTRVIKWWEPWCCWVWSSSLLVITYLALRRAEFFDKFLGETGRLVLARLLGVLLAALSVQSVADGAVALLEQKGTELQ